MPQTKIRIEQVDISGLPGGSGSSGPTGPTGPSGSGGATGPTGPAGSASLSSPGPIGSDTPSTGAFTTLSTAASGASIIQTSPGDVSSGGSVYHRFNDVNGNAGYIGFGGGNDQLNVYNYKNGSIKHWINGTGRLTIDATGATVTGTCSATTFSGSGTSLTAIPPTALTLPVAALTANTAAINTVQTYISPTFQIPANTLAAGDVFKITIHGTCTSTAGNASNFFTRFGTAGTTADTQLLFSTCTGAISGTNVAFVMTIYVTVRTIGSSGTATAFSQLTNSGTTGISQTTNVIGGNGTTATINTTGNLFLGVSYSTAATTTTTTFRNVIVERIR